MTTENKLENLLLSIVLGYSLLIIPMVIIGVFLTSKLQFVVFGYYSLSILLLLIVTIQFASKIHKIDIPKFKTHYKDLYIKFTVVGLLLIYLFFSLIYSERGWDALQFYFPNALYFYLSDDLISGINPFSFYPTFAPPVNTLLITFSLYITKGQQLETYANLHPWIFLVGTVILVYLITYHYSDSSNISRMSVLFFLLTPLTYLLVYEYAYYQELPLMFFFTATFYFLIKNEEEPIFYGIMASISMSMAILSKLSGYSIFLLIFMIIQIKSRSRIFNYSTIIVVTLFLAYKASFDTYIGTGIVLLILGFIVILIQRNDRNQVEISPKHLLLVISIPVIIGLLWLIFMLNIPNIQEYLIETFLTPRTENISNTFPSITNPSLIYFENGMVVSFQSSLLYIFTGVLLGLPWAIFKFFGFFSEFQFKELKLWIISFVMIWLGYFGTVSARYLTAILPGLSITISFGFYKFLSKLAKTPIKELEEKDFVITKLVVTFSGLIFLLPMMPIRYLLREVNDRFYLYHSNQILVVIYAIGFLLFFSTVILIIEQAIKTKWRKRVKGSFLLILLLIVAAPQFYIYASNGFDKAEFNEEASYFHRPAYQELIDSVNNLDIEFTEKIISVNTPGLNYYTTRPVIDLMIALTFEGFENFNNLTPSDTFSFLVENQILLIISLNEGHVYYPVFETRFQPLTVYQIAKDGSNFDLVMQNQEFSLYLRIHNSELLQD